MTGPNLAHLGLDAAIAPIDGALCAQTDPDAWFPEIGQNADHLRAICARCPGRQQCLDEAMRMEGSVGHTSRFGVWGGMTPVERAAMATGERHQPHIVESTGLCLHGHDTAKLGRYRRGGGCVACSRARDARRREAAKGAAA